MGITSAVMERHFDAGSLLFREDIPEERGGLTGVETDRHISPKDPFINKKHKILLFRLSLYIICIRIHRNNII